MADKRLLKLIQQCRTKQVIDYVRQHGVEIKATDDKGTASGQSTKKKNSKKSRQADDVLQHKIHVQRLTDDSIKVMMMLNSININNNNTQHLLFVL